MQGLLGREEDPILYRLGKGEPNQRMRVGKVHELGGLDSGECEPNHGPDAGLRPREVDDED